MERERGQMCNLSDWMLMTNYHEMIDRFGVGGFFNNYATFILLLFHKVIMPGDFCSALAPGDREKNNHRILIILGASSWNADKKYVGKEMGVWFSSSYLKSRNY